LRCLLLTAEHRAAPAPEPISLALVGDDDTHLEIKVDADTPAAAGQGDIDDIPTLDQTVLGVLAAAEAPLTRSQLRARVRVRNERLGEVLTRLASAGDVRRLGDRWDVPDSRSRSR
jgi:hypothetical protein